MPGEPGMEGMPEGGQAQPGEEEKPKRPDDVSEWKKADYISAKEEGDSKLTEAIIYLGEKFAGKPAAARMLAGMLEYKEPEPEPEPDETKPKGPGQPGSRGIPARGRQPGRTARSNVNLIEPLITALALNGTDAARDVLEQLVEGTLTTEDPRKATELALAALADNPSEKSEAILLRAIVEAEKLRKPEEPEAKKTKTSTRPGGMEPMHEGGRGQRPGYPSGQSTGSKMTAEEMRDKTIALIDPVASEQFRLELAKHLLNPKTSDEQYEQLLQVVDRRLPNNVAAQMLLHLSRQVDEQTEAMFEEYFVEYGSEALAGILSLAVEASGSTPGSRRRPSQIRRSPEMHHPAPMRRPSQSRRPPQGRPGASGPDDQAPDPDLPYRLARHLWNAKFRQLIEERLGQVETLEEGAETIALAGTMPFDSMRSEMRRVLKKCWKEGPGPVESAGVPKSLVSDPALLIVLKMIPREEYEEGKSKSHSTRPSRTRSSGRSKSTSRSKPSARTKQVDTAAKRKETGRDWMGFSESFARSLCERFHGATLKKDEVPGSPVRGQPSREPRRRRRPTAETTPEGDKPEPAIVKPDPSLPITLPADANVVTARHIKWPDDVAKKLGGVTVDPMEINYVRIEENTRLVKVKGYYNRQLKSPDSHNVPSGLWLDSLSVSEKPGKKLSIDVLVTPVDAKPTARARDDKEPEEDEDLIIEILTIETNEIK